MSKTAIAAMCGLSLARGLPAAAEPIQFAGSAADALSASFTVHATATGLGPVNPVQGSGPAPYDVHASLSAFNQTIGIATGNQPIAMLAVAAAGMTSQVVASSGVTTPPVGFITGDTFARASLGAVQITLVSPQAGAAPLLTITVRKVTAVSFANESLPGPPAVGGYGEIGAVTVSGALLGGETVSFSGSPAKQQSLIDTPVLSVTLNDQVQGGLISCDPKCTFTPSFINGAAIAVHLQKAPVAGHLLTGDIRIGETSVTVN